MLLSPQYFNVLLLCILQRFRRFQSFFIKILYFLYLG